MDTWVSDQQVKNGRKSSPGKEVMNKKREASVHSVKQDSGQNEGGNIHSQCWQLLLYEIYPRKEIQVARTEMGIYTNATSLCSQIFQPHQKGNTPKTISIEQSQGVVCSNSDSVRTCKLPGRKSGSHLVSYLRSNAIGVTPPPKK